MYTVAPPVPGLLFHRAPGEGEPALVDKGAALVRAANPYHHGSRVGHVSKSFFALAQGRLRAFALGDVLQNRDVVLGAVLSISFHRDIQPSPGGRSILPQVTFFHCEGGDLAGLQTLDL